MAATVGYSGVVTSWAGTPFDVTKFLDASVNFSVDGEELDVTGFGSSLEAMTYIPGLRAWSAQMSGWFPAAGALTGHAGNVSWGDSTYATNVREWSLDIAAAEHDVTVFDGAGVVWRSFVPGLYSWSGTYNAFIDSSTALTVPTAAAGTLGTVTLKLTEDGGTDRTFSGAAMIRQVSGAIPVNGVNTANYAFRGSGALTSAGTNNIIASGAVAKPAVGSLVFQAASGRTYTGNAFATSVQVQVAVDGATQITVNARGSGALTPA